jgi:hypothetical protein
MNSPGERLRYYEHTVSQLDPEAIKKALATAVKNSDVEFQEQLLVLRDLFRKWYPPHILAILAGWGLMAGVGSYRKR